jgi:hypothetical protein
LDEDVIAEMIQGIEDQLCVIIDGMSEESPGVAVPSEEEMQNYHRSQIEAAKAEFRKEPVEDEDMMRPIQGGTLDGGVILTTSNMPIGAKMNLAGEVYELRPDGQLHLADSS